MTPEKTFLQVVAAQNPAPASPPRIDGTRTAPTSDSPYVAAALEDELSKLAAMSKDSGRNSALFEAAKSLGRLPIPRESLRLQLLDACHANGVLQEDGLATCNGSIDSGFNKADVKGPRSIPELGSAGQVIEVEGHAIAGDTAPAEAEEPAGYQFIDGATFILTIPDTIPALWGDNQDVLWAEGESLMIAGPMGLGKTTLAGQLIKAQLGIGKPEVLGLTVSLRPGKVLYLAMDRPAQIARAMARQFGDADAAVLAEKLTIWRGPPPADIAKNPGLLVYLAKQAGADTVYVDSLKDAAIGLSDDVVGAGYNRARQLVLADGIQLAELHHTIKRNAMGGAPTNVADVYGSAWLTNGTGSVILLTGEPGDPIVGFKHPRQPANEVGPFQLLHDQAAGTITVHHTTDLLDMATHCGPEGLTAKGAAIAMFDTDRPSRGQIEKARRKLEKLAEAGLLVSCEGARGRGGDAVATWFPASRGAS